MDAEGSSFFPFLHRSIAPMRSGTGRWSFDLKIPRGVECVIEARYEGKGPGPSLHVTADGVLHASGKAVTTLAADAWQHVIVVFNLDADSPSYALTVSAPGTAPQTFERLPFATPWFFLCDSFYFIGSGEKPGSFFVDNVAFERLPAH